MNLLLIYLFSVNALLATINISLGIFTLKNINLLSSKTIINQKNITSLINNNLQLKYYNNHNITIILSEEQLDCQFYEEKIFINLLPLQQVFNISLTFVEIMIILTMISISLKQIILSIYCIPVKSKRHETLYMFTCILICVDMILRIIYLVSFFLTLNNFSKIFEFYTKCNLNNNKKLLFDNSFKFVFTLRIQLWVLFGFYIFTFFEKIWDIFCVFCFGEEYGDPE